MYSIVAGLSYVVTALIGCAPAPSTTSTPTPAAAPQVAAETPVAATTSQPTNRDLITRADLEGKASANLYDVVSSLRSHWLRGPAAARGSMSIIDKGPPPTPTRGGDPDDKARTGVGAGGGPNTEVYVDGRRFGALTSLRNLTAESAEKLCYFPLNRAQSRFGLSVQAPVIEVFTRASSYSQTAC